MLHEAICHLKHFRRSIWQVSHFPLLFICMIYLDGNCNVSQLCLISFWLSSFKEQLLWKLVKYYTLDCEFLEWVRRGRSSWVPRPPTLQMWRGWKPLLKWTWWQPEGLPSQSSESAHLLWALWAQHIWKLFPHPTKLLRNEIKWWDGIYNPIFTTAKHLSDCACGPQVVKVTVCSGIMLREPVISATSGRRTTIKMSHAVACVLPTVSGTHWAFMLDLLCPQTAAENGLVVIIRGDI